MNILISCLSFKNYTGSELYVYELAKSLSTNHNVDIISNIGSDMVSKIERFGVRCYDIKSPPDYFLGDNKQKIIKNNKTEVTKQGKFYKISNNKKYDLLLLNHPAISNTILNLYNSPALNIVHSEVLPAFEYPIVHPRVKGYVAIRPEIKDYLINKYSIQSDNIEVIYNPIDNERFNNKNVKRDGDYILFVGSYDYLRSRTVKDLIKYSKEQEKELWLVGRDYPKFAENWVRTFKPSWDVEKYVKGASEVASVLLGRTVFEGWLCNKTSRIYNIDEKGNISDIKSVKPTIDISLTNPETVSNSILNFYDRVK